MSQRVLKPLGPINNTNEMKQDLKCSDVDKYRISLTVYSLQISEGLLWILNEMLLCFKTETRHLGRKREM